MRPFGDAETVMGHIHVLAHDVAAMRKFFVDLGGVSIQNGRLIQFPGVYVMVSQGDPTGPMAGSIVNHVGFKLKNVNEAKAKWIAAGLPMKGNYVIAPGGIQMEMNEDTTIEHPMEFYHVHMWVDKPQEVQAWYQKMFGAVPSERPTGNLFMYVGDIPGANLTFSDVMRMGPPAGIYPPLAGTKGRALDHIGFEVKNLQEWCKKAEAMGVKFDRPYAVSATNGKTKVAFFTDPWGTYIEVNENLVGN
jgi:catechol 2,3-dioxygenase-like lactoylglutathione lyase family enzyme